MTHEEAMTPEEAIEMLKSKMDGHTDTSYEWTETIRMAINALELQERFERYTRQDDMHLVTIRQVKEVMQGEWL